MKRHHKLWILILFIPLVYITANLIGFALNSIFPAKCCIKQNFNSVEQSLLDVLGADQETKYINLSNYLDNEFFKIPRSFKIVERTLGHSLHLELRTDYNIGWGYEVLNIQITQKSADETTLEVNYSEFGVFPFYPPFISYNPGFLRERKICTLLNQHIERITNDRRELAFAVKKSLNENGEVTSLKIANTNVTSHNLRIVSGIDSLTELELAYAFGNKVPITADDLRVLKRLKNLRRLTLKGTVENLSKEHCQALCELSQLERLEISRSQIDDEGRKIIQQMNLQSLQIYGPFCEKSGQLLTINIVGEDLNTTNIRSVSTVESVPCLQLSCCRSKDTPLTADDFRILKQMKNLRRMYLRLAVDELSKEHCQAISELTQLEELEIRHSKNDADGVEILRQMSLKSLKIDGKDAQINPQER